MERADTLPPTFEEFPWMLELMARVRALLGETRKATTFWYRWYIPAA
jgi:hypothetical protein